VIKKHTEKIPKNSPQKNYPRKKKFKKKIAKQLKNHCQKIAK